VAGIAGAYADATALYHRDLRGGPDGDGRGQVIDLALLEPPLGIGPGPTVYDQLRIIAGRTATGRRTTRRATPTSLATAAGSRSRPAPPRSPRA
jgi:hypothetical protein